jgi:alkylation response protein AidB-like acyl-CoA dehydrogenase
MVDFTLTDEQKNLREMAHDFAEKEIRPVAWEYDKDGTWPGDIIEKAWEVGLMNSHIEEAYGGAGAGYLDGAARASRPRSAVTAWRLRRSRSGARRRSRRSIWACSPKRRSWLPSV